MKKLARVFGNPISQSKSPQIHEHFAKQFDIPLVYEKQFCEMSQFEDELNTFFANQCAIGANVTLPFKERAFKWVDTLSNEAQRAGAVNTIVRTDTGFLGDNTDGKGLVQDLAYHGVVLENKTVLFIGAGGAAKGAIPALVGENLKSLSIYNRTKQKADDLAQQVRSYANLKVGTFDCTKITAFDVIINATSLSLDGLLPDVPDDVFQINSVVYDMVYMNSDTRFLQHAKQLGCATRIDGIGMLLEQAALSFNAWFGVLPETKALRDLLR